MPVTPLASQNILPARRWMQSYGMKKLEGGLNYFWHLNDISSMVDKKLISIKVTKVHQKIYIFTRQYNAQNSVFNFIVIL